MEPTHLERAPISEALIDLRVKASEPLDVTCFRNIGDQVGREYDPPKEHRTFEGEFNLADGQLNAATRKQTISGFVYQSRDAKHVAQFRTDGFSFSRLHPYTKWEAVCAEAMRLWSIYVKAAAPKMVTRSALRYINRLNVPAAGGKLETYLEVPPRVPEGLGDKVSSFLNRIIVDKVADEFTAIVTQALEPSQQADQLSILLDIDVFTLRPLAPSSEDVGSVLSRIHDVKNTIFFNSITPRVVEIYK